MRAKPAVRIVTPASAAANNGNWHTATRWARLLAPVARVSIAQEWAGTPADLLIALHARRSAASIRRFHAAHPERPLILVLTGTDLYRDFEERQGTRATLRLASHLVVLQEAALARLTGPERERARVIEQSAARLVRHDQARRTFDFSCVGHLRPVKDPRTLMRAARLLPPRFANGAAPRVLHVGAALQPELAAAAERTMAECRAYRWLGPLPAPAARSTLARSRALVQPSRVEGGALALIEALRSDVPPLASRIDGNVGLLGPDYDGYFPAGDAAALARLMVRFAEEPAFASHLAAQGRARAGRFAPQVEAARLRTLLAAALGARTGAPAPENGASTRSPVRGGTPASA